MNYTKTLFLFCTILPLFLCPVSGHAENIAFCYDVADGDTLFVKISNRDETLRLIGIDTPEIKSKYTREEFFGQKSSQFTRSHVKGKMIQFEYDRERRDKYGRLLAYVYLPDGKMLNRLLVEKGYARAYKFFKYKMKEEFIELEKRAKKGCLGLWKKGCRRGSSNMESSL